MAVDSGQYVPSMTKLELISHSHMRIHVLDIYDLEEIDRDTGLEEQAYTMKARLKGVTFSNTNLYLFSSSRCSTGDSPSNLIPLLVQPRWRKARSILGWLAPVHALINHFCTMRESAIQLLKTGKIEPKFGWH